MAQWIIEDGPTDADVTESCTEHVGVMLQPTPETRIYPITDAPQPETLQLPPAYIAWAEACNKVANQPFQPLGAVHAPLLPCPDDPERFWVLFQGVRILKHWSEIPALWATSNQS